MNIYIWERVRHCSGNYHPEGGVVVVAESLEAARAFANNHDYYDCAILECEEPTAVYPLTGDHIPAVFIMPDAGCC